VPFKGGGEATNAILGGSTPIGLIGLGNVTAQISAGKMTALALTNNIRTPLLPNVPTFADLGYKGAPSRTWYGLFAPAGTPKPIIDKLNAEVTRVVSDPAFRDKYIISRGQVPAINTPEEFAKEIAEDRAAAKEVVKESGLEPQ
jgi:tripartite-type tricarboxylate transporter receptor subunit TctC